MRFRIAASIGLLISLAACDVGKPVPKPRANETAVAPTAKVVFTYANDEPFLRFVVQFRNPAYRLTRVGLKTTWKAYNAKGIIVGSLDNSQPPIGPGQSIYYVGGSTGDHLTGTPVKVVVTIKDPGELVDQPVSTPMKFVNASLARSNRDRHDDAFDYDALITLAAVTDVRRRSVRVPTLLWGANRKIVGAGWADLDPAPRHLARGDKVNVRARVPVPKGTPVRVVGYPVQK
jgi:hypothetical protein